MNKLRSATLNNPTGQLAEVFKSVHHYAVSQLMSNNAVKSLRIINKCIRRYNLIAAIVSGDCCSGDFKCAVLSELPLRFNFFNYTHIYIQRNRFAVIAGAARRNSCAGLVLVKFNVEIFCSRFSALATFKINSVIFFDCVERVGNPSRI